MTDADLGYPAWRSFIEFAFGSYDARAAFERDTGLKIPPAPRNGIEAMIDQATGATDGAVEEFVLWASREYGAEFAPPAVRERLAARSK